MVKGALLLENEPPCIRGGFWVKGELGLEQEEFMESRTSAKGLNLIQLDSAPVSDSLSLGSSNVHTWIISETPTVHLLKAATCRMSVLVLLQNICPPIPVYAYKNSTL
jgi:hypothetical protein